MTMDHQLVRADFLGEVTVDGIRLASDGKTVLADIIVNDAWFHRGPVASRITVGVAGEHWGEYRHLVVDKARLVVLLSGGPWIESAFTFRNNSVFSITEDGGIRCTSGNPLFAVHNTGFVCSIQAYMPIQPITLAQMRAATLVARNRAVPRVPDLAVRLDALQRAIEQTPSREEDIDRSLIENEVYR
jgi:hypothetical protein